MSTTEEKIAVMKAFVDGKKIEYRYRNARRNTEEWDDVRVPPWDWLLNDYRVKREPRVIYVNEFDNDYGDLAFPTEDKANSANPPFTAIRKAVKYIEVIE